MAVAAILGYYLATLHHPRSLLGDRKPVFKFHVNLQTPDRL